jgi:hypothetical protein
MWKKGVWGRGGKRERERERQKHTRGAEAETKTEKETWGHISIVINK